MLSGCLYRVLKQKLARSLTDFSFKITCLETVGGSEDYYCCYGMHGVTCFFWLGRWWRQALRRRYPLTTWPRGPKSLKSASTARVLVLSRSVQHTGTCIHTLLMHTHLMHTLLLTHPPTHTVNSAFCAHQKQYFSSEDPKVLPFFIVE